MEKNQNVVEDALFQIRNLEETLQENAKGILQSTMKEEIRQLVKESLREQDEEEIDTDEPATGEEAEVEDDDMDDDMEDDDEMDMDDEDMDMEDDDEMEFGMTGDDMGDDETIDLTNASDDEVLKVFKAMSDEDGIIVKKEGENIRLKDGDNDYMIHLGESYLDEEEDGMGYPEMEEETIYEIEMEDDDDDDDEMEEMDMDMKEEDEMDFETPMRDSMRAHKGKFQTPMRDSMRAHKGRFETPMRDSMAMRSREDRNRDVEDDMSEGVYPEMEEMYGENKHDFKRSNGHKEGDVNGHYKDYEMDEQDTIDLDLGEEFTEEEVDNLDAVMEAVKKAMKPKGVGMGNQSKFKYNQKPNMNGGFNVKKKEGPKSIGTGKAKFEYKEGENMEKGNNTSVKKAETKEAARTLGNGSRDGSRGLRKARTNNRNISYNPIKISEEKSQNEVNLLREKNEEYRQALDVFRTKLNEVAIFNSNLAYATRLFTEHSTTKQEKINVLRRFDNVETLKESKSLYRSIKDELTSGSKTDEKLNESIERTVNKTVSTGSSANLIESKTYENPQFLRMKDLMSKL